MLKINLLDNQRKEILRRQLLAKRLTFFSFIFLALSAVIASVSLISQSILTKTNNNLVEQIALKQQQLASYKSVYQQANKVIAKLDAVSSILEYRDLFNKKMGFLADLITDPLAKITTVDFGKVEDKGSLDFSGANTSVITFDSFSKNLLNQKIKYQLAKINLSNLNRDSQGYYDFDYNISFTEEAPVITNPIPVEDEFTDQ